MIWWGGGFGRWIGRGCWWWWCWWGFRLHMLMMLMVRLPWCWLLTYQSVPSWAWRPDRFVWVWWTMHFFIPGDQVQVFKIADEKVKIVNFPIFANFVKTWYFLETENFEAKQSGVGFFSLVTFVRNWLSMEATFFKRDDGVSLFSICETHIFCIFCVTANILWNENKISLWKYLCTLREFSVMLYFEMHEKAVTFPIFALGQWDGTSIVLPCFSKDIIIKR